MHYLGVTNVEMVLLSLVDECPGVSGYAMDRLVEARGYRAWADLGTTSLYKGLKKLVGRGLVRSEANPKKSGRGPQGRVFHLTKVGRATFEREVLHGLANTREHDPRFNLALSVVHRFPRATVVAALEDRSRFLKRERSRVKKAFDRQKDILPEGGVLLFQRILHTLAAEIRWLGKAMTAVPK